MPCAPVPVAVFVSPHGFGHAARACSVMSALHQRVPQIRFEIFTTVPRWFFADSLHAPFALHRVITDVGLVQHTSLHEDLNATVQRLEELAPTAPACAEHLAARLQHLGCRLVLSDISPLGLSAARVAGLPGVLVENFTWDWIYSGYAPAAPGIERHVDAVASAVADADLHIQATPVCRLHPAARVVPPVSRSPRSSPAEVRSRLGIPPEAPLVLITMGGVPWDYDSLDVLCRHPTAYFVVPGGGRQPQRLGRLTILGHRSAYYHPDLIRASNVVVAKLGYSTLAEVFHAPAAFAFIARSRFPESAPLSRFALEEMAASEIPEQEFTTWRWLQRLDELLGRARPHTPSENGASKAARLITDLL